MTCFITYRWLPSYDEPAGDPQVDAILVCPLPRHISIGRSPPFNWQAWQPIKTVISLSS